MKSCHHVPARTMARSVLGGIALVCLASGCGGTAADGGTVGDVNEGLHSATGSSAQELRSAAAGRRRHGGQRGRRHHGGSNGGGPVVEPCNFIDQDTLFQTINADLARLDIDDRPFIRYLTLANRNGALGCGAALDGDRAAINELINSVSIDARATPLVAVDAQETLYRLDLRDYGLDRAIAVGGKTFTDAWEALIAGNPYALPFVGDDADDAVDDTGTRVPVLFGSVFVAAAARAPLYYALLDIPADADDFLRDDLGIDVASGETARAGFTAAARGGDASFLAQRFDIEVRAGFAWQISEFGDLFEDPLGSADGERELVFTLPNGLLGHVLADANGRVKSSSDVLLDRLESDGHAKIATSFFRSRANGVELTDEVRDFARANPGNFSASELAAIRAAYPGPGALQLILDDDRASFSGALERIGLDIATRPEPMSQSFADFDADVDLATAAGDLFLTPDDLRDNIDLLDPVFSVLAGGGKLDRDDFNALYGNAACIFTVVLDNQPDVVFCDAAAAAAQP
jgi:hypothetical protein